MSKRTINSRLSSETRRYDIKLADVVENEIYGKNATLLGENAGDTFAGITCLETTRFFEGDVVFGDAMCDITSAVPNLSGLVNPSTTEINYSTATINANLNDSGFVSFDSAQGSFVTSISGGGVASSVASIITLLTGLTSSTGFDKLASGGGLPSIQDVMDKAEAKAGSLLNDVKSSFTTLGASAEELTDFDKVSQSISFGSIDDVARSVSSVNGLNPAAKLKDTVANVTSVSALSEKVTEAKNILDDTNGIRRLVKKAKDAVGTINQLADEIDNLNASSLLRTSAGLLPNGLLQDINEVTGGKARNFLQGLTGNNVVFTKNEATTLLGQIASGSESELADVVKTVVTSKSDVSERDQALINQVETPASTTDLINEINRLGKQQGYAQEEINEIIEKVKSTDTSVRNYDTTIGGSIIVEAPLFDEPILLSDAENDWQGKASKNSVFTFISSVEELEVEFSSIKREITEVVVHASETHSNKNIGSEEIHFNHNKLGHDGIGYHYVIRRDGRLQRGRPVNKEGEHAAVNNHNKRSIGLVLIGGLNTSTGQNDVANFRSAQSFTREQYTTLEIFLSKFYQKYPGGQVFGHNDIDVNEIDPYFDVIDYIETVFNKRNTTKLTLDKEPLKSSEIV